MTEKKEKVGPPFNDDEEEKQITGFYTMTKGEKEKEYEEYKEEKHQIIKAYTHPFFMDVISKLLHTLLDTYKVMVKEMGYERAKIFLIEQSKRSEGYVWKELGKKKGITNPLLTLYEGEKVSWYPLRPLWKMKFIPDEKNPVEMVMWMACPVGNFFRDPSLTREDRELGLIMCDHDFHSALCVDPRVKLERPMMCYFADGPADKICKFVWKLQE